MESKMNGILLDLVYKFSESSKVDYEVNGKAFSLVMCLIKYTHLFPSNCHVIFNITEDSRLDEVAAVSCRSATTHELSALTLPTADVAKNLLELFLIHLQKREKIVTDALPEHYAVRGLHTLVTCMFLEEQKKSTGCPYTNTHVPSYISFIDL